MISIRFYCLKCDLVKVKDLNIPYAGRKNHFIDGSRIVCEDCKKEELIEIRNKKIESIINKKWWKF